VNNSEINIIQNIQELLLWHDCVIIPDFGGFVANVSGSKIDQKKNTFTPPYKKIAFNRNLSNNDGLLANHLASRNGIVYKEAVELLNDFSKKANETLKKGKELELEGIGKIKPSGPTITFEPSSDKNYLLDSFGLIEFHSPVIKRDPIQRRIEKEFKDRKLDKKYSNTSSLKKWLIAAAALPAAILLTFSPIQSKIYKDIQTNYTIAIPFYQEAAVYQQRNIELDAENKQAESTEEEIINSEPVIVAAPSITTPEILPENISVSTTGKKSFHLIGGCFSIQKNAEKFMKDLRKKGFQPQIVDQHNGLFRVSYNSFDTREEAVSALIEIKSNNSSAWILAAK
jgi:cell division septation protein DedD